jgi:opacity protein-like surface antigen
MHVLASALTRATLTLASLALTSHAVQAQAANESSRWSMEVTGDGAFPTGKLGGAELKTGFGFGASVQARLQQHLQAYAGWEWHRFKSDELLVEESTDVEETGYTFGLRFAHPFTGEATTTRGTRAAPGYWLRAGGLINHIELEDEGGDVVSDTKHGLGWEVGAGVTVPLSDRFSLTPGVRFRSLPRDLTVGSITRSVTLNYATATVGLTFAF